MKNVLIKIKLRWKLKNEQKMSIKHFSINQATSGSVCVLYFRSFSSDFSAKAFPHLTAGNSESVGRFSRRHLSLLLPPDQKRAPPAREKKALPVCRISAASVAYFPRVFSIHHPLALGSFASSYSQQVRARVRRRQLRSPRKFQDHSVFRFRAKRSCLSRAATRCQCQFVIRSRKNTSLSR